MSLSKPFVLAIDGPAASGKGTLAKRLATHYGLSYLDTGSLYRAVGFKVKSSNIDVTDESAIVEIAASIDFGDTQRPDLYDEGVGGVASQISAIEAVRAALLDFQKSFAARAEGAVLDGRDIGTVICPHADYKFFITADIEARARRRYKQLQNKGNPVIYADVLGDLKRRDERDSQRAIAPLQRAEDAVHIDTTHMSADEVFENICTIIG